MKALKRGNLAKMAGVNIETIRYYEKQGILPEPDRSPSGYRQYDEETVNRIRFVKRAQKLGFSLSEIKQLLKLSEGEITDCDEVKDIALKKLEAIREKIINLQKLDSILSNLATQCDRQQTIKGCPIIEALMTEEVEK
ncbi:MAG: Hg(II)-responsive transcriptional regulator [candidate division Zixibacteria bacterium]